MSKNKKVIPIRKTPQQVADAFDKFEGDIQELIQRGYKNGLNATHIVYVLQYQAYKAIHKIKDTDED